MQTDTSIQLTPVPPKPTCTPLFNTGSCADLWRNYNQALQQRQREEIQLYVRRQKDLAATQATAPLQQQIADLNKLITDQQSQIKQIQVQMQADASFAIQQAQAARTKGLEQGTGIGVGATLILFVIVLGIRRLMRTFSVSRRPQAHSASAH